MKESEYIFPNQATCPDTFGINCQITVDLFQNGFKFNFEPPTRCASFFVPIYNNPDIECQVKQAKIAILKKMLQDLLGEEALAVPTIITWHKIDDEDFPEIGKEVFCYTRCGEYTIGKLTNDNPWKEAQWDLQNNSRFYEGINAVVAWTELPKCEVKQNENI